MMEPSVVCGHDDDCRARKACLFVDVRDGRRAILYSPCSLFFSVAAAARSPLNVTISVPATYNMFSGELLVSISVSGIGVYDVDSWSIEVVCIELCQQTATRDSRVVASIAMTEIAKLTRSERDNGAAPREHKTWKAAVPCEVISSSGRYLVQLSERSSDNGSISECGFNSFQCSVFNVQCSMRYYFRKLLQFGSQISGRVRTA